MKKVLIGLLLLLGLCSCYSGSKNTEVKDTDFLVEEKYMSWTGGYYFVISDLDTKVTHTISVGEYTYKITNPGDTVTIKSKIW